MLALLVILGAITGVFWILYQKEEIKPMFMYTNGTRTHDFTENKSGKAIYIVWGTQERYQVSGVGGDGGLPCRDEIILLKLKSGGTGRYRVAVINFQNTVTNKWAGYIKMEGEK